MKFKKKQFQKEYKSKDKPMDELYKLGDEYANTPNLPSISQITTDTIKSKLDDFSDYENGNPIDGDKAKILGKNTSIRQASPFAFNMGSPYIKEDNIEETAKERMERLIKELLQSKSDDREFVPTGNSDDLNNNNIPDISELDKPEVITTLNAFIDAVNGNDLNANQLKVVMNYLNKNIKKV